MTDTDAFTQKWERAADIVLAVLLAEPSVHKDSRERWDKARYEHMLMPYHFPAGQYRMVYEAMEAVRLKDDTLHHSLVLTADPRISQDWMNGRIALYSELIDGEVFYKHLATMLECGETARVKGLLMTAQTELTDGKRDEVVAHLMTNLATTGVETIKADNAMEAALELEAYLQGDPSKLLSSGIPCLDAWTDGISRGDVWGLGAPYKMRKSTLARNIALNMARHGASVAILMYESNKKIVAAQFVTMLACEWLKANGHYEADLGKSKLRWWLSARRLMRVRAGYLTWDKRLVAAINYGLSEYKKLGMNLRIYDKSGEGGALSDLASAHRVLLRDKRLYETDIAFIDHISQINEAGADNDYLRMQKAAPFLETFARRYEIALVILAQLSEKAINSAGDDHSPGVKGGGDLPAAVDFFFKTFYQEKDEMGARRAANTMRVVMHLSRFGPGNADEKRELIIDPVTGLIFGETKVVSLNDKEDAA